jgi:hypothetical protein
MCKMIPAPVAIMKELFLGAVRGGCEGIIATLESGGAEGRGRAKRTKCVSSHPQHFFFSMDKLKAHHSASLASHSQRNQESRGTFT